MSDEALQREFERRVAKVDDQIRKADFYEGTRQVDDALTAYRACFDVAREHQVPLFMPQLAHIWMGMGFCYADRNQYDQALPMYQRVESMLHSFLEIRRRTPEEPSNVPDHVPDQWSTFIPDGVEVIAPVGYDPLSDLVNAYESIALTYDNMNRLDKASEYYQKALDGHARLQRQEGVLRVWYYQVVLNTRRADWDGLQTASENMLKLAETIQDDSARIAALQGLAMACMSQWRLMAATFHLKQAIELERQLNHPELARDERWLNDLLVSLPKRVGLPHTAHLLDLTRLPPVSALIDEITLETYVERGMRELAFVVHTSNLEVALKVFRAFPLMPLPLDVAFMRNMTQNASSLFPKGENFRIQWKLADLEIGELPRTVIPDRMRAELHTCNQASQRFRLLVEDRRRPFGAMRREPFPRSYSPYVLDWFGVEGIAAYIRSAWEPGHSTEIIEYVMGMLSDRVTRFGFATGLMAEMGLLYDLLNQPERATMAFVEELKFALTPEYQLGAGAIAALINLGHIFKRHDDIQRAQLAYQLVLHLHPNSFEGLIGLSSVTQMERALPYLSRAYRVHPDNALFNALAKALTGSYARAIPNLLRLIQESSETLDLLQPAPGEPIHNVKEALQRLLGETPQTEALSGPLASIDHISRVLTQFMALLSPETRWSVSTEQAAVFRNDVRPEYMPAVMLRLSEKPELKVRVLLDGETCTVDLMHELRYATPSQKVLRSAITETCPAQAEALVNTLKRWIENSILYQFNGEWHIRMWGN